MPTAEPKPISDYLNKHLNDAMASVPSTGTGALTADVSLEGYQVQFVQKLSKTWAVGAWGGGTWAGDRAAGVRLTATW